MSSTSSLAGKKIVLNTLLETDHYESLIKELTCTKCNKYMRPPIHLCVDGHSLCGKCFEKSFQCHVCQKEFASLRPVALEALANKILFPCTNKGCPKHTVLSQLDIHNTHCQFRIINCFMSRVYGECKWKGCAGDWMDHCFQEHGDKVTDLPFITVRNKWDAKRTEPVLNYFLLRCYEKVFNVYQIYDKRGGFRSQMAKMEPLWIREAVQNAFVEFVASRSADFYKKSINKLPMRWQRCVDCMGRMMWTVLVNDVNAEKYYFEIDIFLPNLPSKRITYRRPCKCEKDADFLEHTQNVYIPVENVFSMLDEDEQVNFIVRIGEVENLPLFNAPTESESMILLQDDDHKDLKE